MKTPTCKVVVAPTLDEEELAFYRAQFARVLSDIAAYERELRLKEESSKKVLEVQDAADG